MTAELPELPEDVTHGLDIILEGISAERRAASIEGVPFDELVESGKTLDEALEDQAAVEDAE